MPLSATTPNEIQERSGLRTHLSINKEKIDKFEKCDWLAFCTDGMSHTIILLEQMEWKYIIANATKLCGKYSNSYGVIRVGK